MSDPNIIRCAGVLLYARSTGQMLALHHAKESCWGIPGGKAANEQEMPWDTAMRELREETGYTGTFLDYTALPANRVTLPNDCELRYWTYLCVVPEPFIPCLPAQEIMDHQWVSEFQNWPRPWQRGIDFLAQNDVCQTVIRGIIASQRMPHCQPR